MSSMTYREVVQGEPVDGGRFNGEGGVRKEWWWQAGPVDSCCCCCSLRAGVAILATLDLLYKGIWATFYMPEDTEKSFYAMIQQLQHNYVRQCTTGHAAESDRCVQLAHTIEQLEDELVLFDNLPAVFYVQGVIAIIAGVAGLWAVFGSNAVAAKVYMWTWLPRFLAMMATEIVEYSKMKEYGLEQHPAFTVVAELVNLAFVVYFVKVLWSYQQRLKVGASDASSPAQGAESIQLSSGFDGV